MTHQEAIVRARTLAPVVRQRAAIAETTRRQPPETIEDITDSGLLPLMVPKRWGGYELGFDTLVDTTLEIARADASAGWCYSLLVLHSWLVALLPYEAQQTVWHTGPEALVATSFQPAGKASPVTGGYLLSGNWDSSSGIDYAEWIILTGTLSDTTNEETSPIILFLLPRQDCSVSDNWFVAGQKGSGTKSIEVNDVFIPQNHTMQLNDVLLGKVPGAEINPDPLYRIPLMAAFPAALVAPIIGAAWGAYEFWRDTSRDKYTLFTHRQVASLSHQQIRLAETAAEVEAAETLLRRALEVIQRGTSISLELRAYNRRNYAYAARLCVQAVERLYLNSGSSANYESNPLQRYWRDIHAMAAHAALNFDGAAEAFSRLELGLIPDPRDPYAS